MSDEIQILRDELNERISTAREAIADAGLENDWPRAQAIAKSVTTLQTSLQRLVEVRVQIRQALAQFDQLTRTTTRAARTKPIITIHWRIAGHDLDDQTLDEGKGADTFALYVERLVSVLGGDILPIIQRIRMGGSGLVSQSPHTDFVNPATSELYGFKNIGGTSWFLKTHSSTNQKDEQIHQIKTLLGLPSAAIETEIVASAQQ
jgi:hypothetical protein